jgi:hypothetical protein
LLALGAVLALAATTAGEAAAPPQADAGLDQTVSNGSVVYLDAGGSLDPDGNITATRWTITAPNGTRLTPTCANCTQTQFRPTQLGQYNATVTVENDAGQQRADTLYVTVEERPGPEVELRGPGMASPGQSTPFEVDAVADDASLATLTWSRNGSYQTARSLNGSTQNLTIQRRFNDTGVYRVTATVHDDLGYTGTDSVKLVVLSGGGGGGGGGSCFYGESSSNGGDKCSDYTSVGGGDAQGILFGIRGAKKNEEGESVYIRKYNYDAGEDVIYSADWDTVMEASRQDRDEDPLTWEELMNQKEEGDTDWTTMRETDDGKLVKGDQNPSTDYNPNNGDNGYDASDFSGGNNNNNNNGGSSSTNGQTDSAGNNVPPKNIGGGGGSDNGGGSEATLGRGGCGSRCA